MKVYNKLVRDLIPNIIRDNNQEPVIKILDNDEYIKELDKKLIEEVNEYLESGSLEEIADILEVIYAILQTRDVTTDQIEDIRSNKAINRGGFKERIYLKEVK